jgi:chromosome partitioning protein
MTSPRKVLQLRPLVIALVGQKGGIGKSTIALALALALHRLGYRVIVIDADDEQRTAITFADVAEENEHDTPTITHLGDNLRTQLPRLVAGYDVAIVDTPGRNGKRATYALGLADLAILPCGPTGPDLWAMSATIEQVQDVQALRPGLDAAILITRKQPNTVIGRRVRKAFDEAELDVLETELFYRVAYGEAITGGQGPTVYEPDGEAAREVTALMNEISRRIGLGLPGYARGKVKRGSSKKANGRTTTTRTVARKASARSPRAQPRARKGGTKARTRTRRK